MKYIIFKCVNYADLLFFKFSAHSSVVLKLHKFSYFLVFETAVLYENTVPPP